MSARAVGHFQVARRSSRAAHLVPDIRRYSKLFKAAVAAGDGRQMTETSKKAWEAMTNLFDVLRNEQDHGNLSASYMNVPTGLMAKPVTAQEQATMVSAQRIDKNHPDLGALTLREALNKIAHYDTGTAAYRLDHRGAHYLVLGGQQGSARWVVEILVSRLCKNAATAVAAIA